ncbi:MAG: phosphoribosyltransferase family protein [Parvibaculales bacterium]
MKPITKEALEELRDDKSPKRIHFASSHEDALKKNEEKLGTLNLPFKESLEEYGFSWALFTNKHQQDDNPHAVWRSIKIGQNYEQIEKWIEERREIVILRSLLTASVALAIRKDAQGVTPISQNVVAAKSKEHTPAINNLVQASCNFLNKNPKFREVDYICAIPAETDKYNLPRILAREISKKLGLTDITSHFCIAGEKSKLRKQSVDKKWQALEGARISIEMNLQEKRVLLIDDTYQSGITMHYIAMLLQNKGAKAIYGLAMQKTRRDTDNRYEPNT